MEDGTLSRRCFLQRTSAGLGVAGMGLGGTAFGKFNLDRQTKTPPPPQVPLHGGARVGEEINLKSYHIWDGHSHL